MRSILLHAHDDQAFEARLQVALDLARAFDGHVTCIQAVSLDFAMPGDFEGMLSTEMAHVMRERAEAFRARTEVRLELEDVRWEWDDRIGLGDSVLQEYAALSDVAVVGSGNPENEAAPSWLAGGLAIHARVPVLAVPQGCPGLQCGAPALVCWNGTVESSRALRAAVPLLVKSERVTLATVGDGETDGETVDLPPVQGAEYLARHGIDCEIVRFPWTSRKEVAGQLREAARARNAGLVVMGAYGHARMLETLLGGVTRDMLT
ncbi:universal stress protein [Altererythrobacter salegens]|uniref:Universal stress protein n=1 Tax=Croceibacterium salegens TaxID=1737568 RepID=A0A6I4SW56_9SPHN|nr:universal stress protein [Croceibacterium salegens]MXO60255.1 universal stress protein [Croceibacterium salegens]